MNNIERCIDALDGQTDLQIKIANLLRQINHDREVIAFDNNKAMKREVIKELHECEELLHSYDTSLTNLLKLSGLLRETLCKEADILSEEIKKK